MMAARGRRWMIALLRLKPVAPLCSRDASVIRTETRALIRIANETERALSAAAELNDRSVSVGGDLLQGLTVAENQLMRSIARAISASVSVRVIEQEVIGPILQGAVVLSTLARHAVERAVRSATHGVHA